MRLQKVFTVLAVVALTVVGGVAADAVVPSLSIADDADADTVGSAESALERSALDPDRAAAADESTDAEPKGTADPSSTRGSTSNDSADNAEADDSDSDSEQETEPEPSDEETESDDADSTESEPATEQDSEPAPEPILRHEDTGDRVRELEARLVQLSWLESEWVDDYYGTQTRDAVAGFQAKRGIAQLGYVDHATWDVLVSMTRQPTRDELHPPEPTEPAPNTGGALDPRCQTGRAICIDKTSQTLRWVVDGRVDLTMDARFGCSSSPTREGAFSVNAKVRDGYSNFYDTRMPFSLFFSGHQAVHYSDDFSAVGYNGCSHGCVNIRDWNTLETLFGRVQVGDKVIVYWS